MVAGVRYPLAHGITAGWTPAEGEALHWLLSIMVHGEQVAMQGARLQSTICTQPAARRFFRQQARHEFFHKAVFAGVARGIHAGAFAPMPAELANWQAQIECAVDRGELLESLLVQQVFLEGLGHAVLLYIDRELANSTPRLRRIRKLILRQEEQHHEFGLQYFRHELEHNPDAGEQLRHIGIGLFEQAEALLDYLAPGFRALGAAEPDFLTPFEQSLPTAIPGVTR